MELWKKPVNKPEVDPANAETNPSKPPEKSAAELIAEALNPFIESQREYQTKLDERLGLLEQNTKRPEPKQTSSDNQPISVLDDENMAFAQRMTPILARQLELESRVVKNDIKAEYVAAGYGDLWNKYSADIEKMLGETALVNGNGQPLRGDPQYIRNVVDMIFGREARKAGMRFGGKDQGFFLETGSGSQESSASTNLNDGLNENQRKLMQRMGIPLDKAKETMKKLQFVN